jgi:hypothetical protein
MVGKIPAGEQLYNDIKDLEQAIAGLKRILDLEYSGYTHTIESDLRGLAEREAQ